MNITGKLLLAVSETVPTIQSRPLRWLLTGLVAGLLAVGFVQSCARGFDLLAEGLAQAHTPNLRRPV